MIALHGSIADSLTLVSAEYPPPTQEYFMSIKPDEATFYFLQQLVHSLSRFLSIFRKLVLTTVATLKQHTMPEAKLAAIHQAVWLS